MNRPFFVISPYPAASLRFQTEVKHDAERISGTATDSAAIKSAAEPQIKYIFLSIPAFKTLYLKKRKQ